VRGLTLIMFLGLLLSGCASQGPMKKAHGLMTETELFDPIFINSLEENSSEKVIYKKPASNVSQGDPGFSLVSDALVVTDQGIYFVRWNTYNYSFVHKINIPLSSVRGVDLLKRKQPWIGAAGADVIVKTEQDLNYRFRIYDGSEDMAVKAIDDQLDDQF